MIHEILPVGPLQCNCSVIGDETLAEAMVIDPGDDIEDVLALIHKHNLQVKQIVITHAHIDHVGGAMKLRAATGRAHPAEPERLRAAEDARCAGGVDRSAHPRAKSRSIRALGSADTVKAGSLSASVIHTPGHTEGSVCLYFPAEKKLIAGDTLFAGSIGRTDLPGGSIEEDHPVAARQGAGAAR